MLESDDFMIFLLCCVQSSKHVSGYCLVRILLHWKWYLWSCNYHLAQC